MHTECNSQGVLFQGLCTKKITADFKGGSITSDAGGLLLAEIERARGFIKEFSRCFTDHRDPGRIDHSAGELLSQRIMAIALGYEDLNDHDRLRSDPLLAALSGKQDPLGRDRRCGRDRGVALAGKSTLNRLELTAAEADPSSRYKKIVCDEKRVEQYFVQKFLDSYDKAPEEIILDIDATDDIIHGNQEGRFFHGYYDHYCYLPLYIFCGDHPLVAALRTSNRDASSGSKEHLERVIGQIRERWPRVRILVRGDGGFCRDKIMSWCESQRDVYFILGMARNQRLRRIIGKAMGKAQRRYGTTRKSTRVFRTFSYRTRKSWSRKRKVVAKAEYLAKGENARFIVTNLPHTYGCGRYLYEKIYCARGDMENRIKEQQLWLFADRTSTAQMRSNQLRLWFSTVAYMLVAELRRVGLKGTRMAKAQAGTIRNRLLKIGALVKVSVRRVLISMSSAFPLADLFLRIIHNIRAQYPLLA